MDPPVLPTLTLTLTLPNSEDTSVYIDVFVWPALKACFKGFCFAELAGEFSKRVVMLIFIQISSSRDEQVLYPGTDT